MSRTERLARTVERMAERNRERVARSPLTSELLRITISIGVAYARVSSSSGSDELLDRFINTADGLLYDAKSTGRNCVRARQLTVR